MRDNSHMIVLIEDEKPIRHFLGSALQEAGFHYIEADTGKQGLVDAATRKPDLIILDLGLPDMDGIDVIKQLRAWSDVPILILSARSRETEKVMALDAGADDYLTKPFGVAECLARVRVLLRRRQASNTTEQSVFEFGNIRVDLAKRIVEKAGEHIHLTPIEYRLLVTLIRHAGKVLTHRELLREVWGPSYAESNQYVRIYMGYLRQKLEEDPAQPRYILTETGVGYRLVTD